MKKGKIQKKLSLDKMTIAQLNDHHAHAVVGGAAAASLLNCNTKKKKCHPSILTKGIFCKKN
ncbi:MAG: class I lanthipeptide [Bacteroidota bacterium]